ncbi:MAG: iron complex outermembrane receptor protein [Phenylobacterium sp.]|jgi:iron complex outermembrane receptor protein
MFNNSKTASAVRLALVLGATASAAIAAPAAFAAEGDEAKVERVQVTGSRIKRTEMEGANPVQVLTAQDIKISGIDNVGDLLQEIPAVAGAATNTSINNGGAGEVRISLRGLGSQYTLVLLNGRRIVASGTGADNSVDVGNIPTAIIQRVEILKDGASAIYGSDAIGGVVNIITRQDFDGAEFNISYDQSTHSGDGSTKTLDFVVGTSTDKGAVLASAFYSQQKAQWAGDRDWSAFEVDMDIMGEKSKGGSSAPPWTNLFEDSLGDGCGSATHGAGSGPGQSDPSDHRSAGWVCRDGSVDQYNYAPANYHLTPNERYGVFVSGNYELNDSMNFFTEISYTNRTAKTKLAPIPLAPLAFFGWDAPYTADNYYNMTQGPQVGGSAVQISDWRRRVVETGGRDNTYTLHNTRAVFGMEGDLFGTDWGYEVSYIFGKNQSTINRAGGVNFEKVELATGASFADTDGSILCGTPDAVVAGCVPLNIFGVPGTDTQITQEMLDYISFEAHDTGENEQQIISGSVFGDLFDLPAGTVGLAVGIEHRKETGSDSPDALIALGITSGSSRLSTSGGYEVDELFAETTIPLLAGVVGAEALDIDIAVRYSDYDTFGDDTNYKFGLKWKPTEDLLIRGTVSTAFRAPSTSDLFAGQSANSPTVEDRCATNPTPTCIADGVPAAGFEPIGAQLSSTRGGNTNLEAEEADTFTIGVVYNPSFVENLEFTVDYWDIELTNAISTIGEQLILDKCRETGLYCDKIVRHGPTSPLYGNSSDIDDRNTNVGGVDSSGYDFNARYNMETGLGLLKINVDMTYYATYDKHMADGSIVPHAGSYWDNSSGDGNFPKYKTNLNIGLFNDDWSASYTLRYIGDVEEKVGTGGIDAAGVWDPVNASFRTEQEDTTSFGVYRDVGSMVIQDIRFTYFLDKYSVSFGVDNIFDEDPPYLASGFNDNTDPRTYATQGRHLSLGLSAKF